MSKETILLNVLAEILEVEENEIELTSNLEDYAWDSLAIVTFISEADSNFDVVLNAELVGKAKSPQDLLTLVLETSVAH